MTWKCARMKTINLRSIEKGKGGLPTTFQPVHFAVSLKTTPPPTLVSISHSIFYLSKTPTKGNQPTSKWQCWRLNPGHFLSSCLLCYIPRELTSTEKGELPKFWVFKREPYFTYRKNKREMILSTLFYMLKFLHSFFLFFSSNVPLPVLPTKMALKS